MTQCIIICLMFIVVVSIACYTIYKCHKFKVDKELIEQYMHRCDCVDFLLKVISSQVDRVWDSLQVIKQNLRKQDEKDN